MRLDLVVSKGLFLSLVKRNQRLMSSRVVSVDRLIVLSFRLADVGRSSLAVLAQCLVSVSTNNCKDTFTLSSPRSFDNRAVEGPFLHFDPCRLYDS